ncbi:MAG: IS110 family transposase [Candidatus Obscuribacterales bacterium]|nr:IS110 family transposase [Candidatus Obscuribacterales bacterium]
MEFYLGIDISKATFDVHLLGLTKGKHRKFSNSQLGFYQLSEWLTALGVGEVHACMEATGRYWDQLAEYLHAKTHRVSAINPARIKGFSQSLLSRLKTDKADAEVIALFCQALKPRLWTPPAAHIRELQELVRHQAHIKQTIQREKNRLQSGLRSETICRFIEGQIEFLSLQLTQVEKDIDVLVDSEQELKTQCELLLSIPGIGKRTAMSFLSEITNVNNFSSIKQLVAYAGLAPSARASGSSLHRPARISKIGNARLRKSLYFPAMVAEVSNPVVAEFSNRLKQNGIRPMPRVVASMRKLLHIMFGVLKSRTPFKLAVSTH